MNWVKNQKTKTIIINLTYLLLTIPVFIGILKLNP